MGLTPRPKPVLCVLHDDRGVRDLLEHDLERRFGGDYAIESHLDARLAIRSLRRYATEMRVVAAVFSADTAACGGSAFREEVRDLHPHARRVLILERGAWSTRHPAVTAMRTGQAESYIFVPWGPRERWLYLPVSELLADWEASQQPPVEVASVIGEDWAPRTHELRDLLSRAGIPFRFHVAGSDVADAILEQAGVDNGELPVLLFRSGTVLVDPSYERVAAALGFATEPEAAHCQLAIIGAGPAGLAAAVYGASEGLETVVIEEGLPGGQAGTSSRIRNYLGFPTGLSGRDLTNRALEQAWFFGARVILSKPAAALRPSGNDYIVELQGAPAIRARTVVIATGVSWRRLPVPSLEPLHGAGVFYGAAVSDATPDANRVFIVGAGNSAGQAAVHLARSAEHVTLVVRGEQLAASMSDYLVRELEKTPNIYVRFNTEIADAAGTTRLTALTLRDSSGTTEQTEADALYVMIGARPHTEWLNGTLARDEQGYILTGTDMTAQATWPWPLERPPNLLETSLPGVYAAGDVRYGSVKRVASAVGAGSIAVQFAHLRLAELHEQ